MAADLEAVAAYQGANRHIWQALQEHIIREGRPANLDEATEYVRQGVKMILDVLAGPAANVDDHVGIRLEDLRGDLTKVAINMEAKSDHGATVVQLFGFDTQDQVTA